MPRISEPLRPARGAADGGEAGGAYAGRLRVPAESLADAWYASIWSEPRTLIPLRHLARRLARLAAGAPW